MEKLHAPQQFAAQALKSVPLFQGAMDDYQVRWEYKMGHNQKGLFVDFIQTLTTDQNKWQQPGVVSDKILRRFCFAQTLLDLGLDQQKLAAYIEANFRQPQAKGADFDFSQFQTLAQSSHTAQVSLPTGCKIPREPRRLVTTFLPVTVKFDNHDLSYFFEDYDKFGPEIVERVFKRVTSGKIPQNTILRPGEMEFLGEEK